MKTGNRIITTAATFFLGLLFFSMAPFVFASEEPVEVVEVDSADEWELVFSDDFNRKEIGDDWEILRSRKEWVIRDNGLEGSGELLINRKFRGYHRIEFSASSDPDAPCDLSPFIHASSAYSWLGGYLLQFGGHQNTANIARRYGQQQISQDYEHMIEPGKTHHIAAEFDGEYVRLAVDGKEVHSYRETSPLTGEGHERIGLYIHNPGRVEHVKVYLKSAGKQE